MMMCWQNDPEARPTFADLRNKLKEMESHHRVRLLSSKHLFHKCDCILRLLAVTQ